MQEPAGSGKPWTVRRIAIGLAIGGAALLLAGLATLGGRDVPPADGQPGERAITIDRADFEPLAPIGSPAAPERGAVALPHRCDAPGADCAGSYRFTFEPGAPPAGDWSLYVPTFTGRLRIWLNGSLVADSRELRTSLVIDHTEPLLAPLPDELLRAGENAVEVRLEIRSPVRLAGFLDRVTVGPDTVLRPAFERRRLLLRTLPQLLVAWQGALALALLVVWAGRPGERVYLTLSAVLALGVLHGLTLFASGDDSALLRAANLTGLWQAALLPGLVAPLLGRKPPLPLYWALAPPSSISALFLLSIVASVPAPAQLGTLWMAVGLPWTILMLGLAVLLVVDGAVRRRDVAARLLLAGMSAAAVLAGHDVLTLLGLLPDQRVLLSRFSGPLVATVISALLMWRFAMALNEVSRFNDLLRREVAAAEAALHASFARDQERLRQVALESERLRLTRDLHDGLAGQLISIVAQCELQGRAFGTVGAAARRALDDLRLVIASLDDVGDDLALMLAQFRERIEPQLRAQGVALDWQMTRLPELAELRSEHTLALFRILQEAVGNAVRHSGAAAVTIAMTPAPPHRPDHGIRIVVADRGRGGAAERPGGQGLANMRRRATAMGADLEIDSGAGGTRVTIDLPRVLPGLAGGTSPATASPMDMGFG